MRALLSTRASLLDDGPLAGILFLAVVAFGLTLYWMTKVGYPERLFTAVEIMKKTPQWIVWVVTVSIQVAVWMALLGPILVAAKRAKSKASPAFFAYAAFVVLLLALPVLSNGVFARPHLVQEAFAVRMRVLTGIGSVIGLIAAFGILRTGREIRSLELPKTPGVQEVNEYLDARRRLLFLGGSLAAIVALAILATGGLRNTIVAMETTRATAATAEAAAVLPEDFPQEPEEVDEEDAAAVKAEAERQTAAAASAAAAEKSRLLKEAADATARASRFGVEVVGAFGLYYSFALVLVFLPAYFSLTALGRKLRDRLQPGLLPSEKGFEAAKKTRDELDQMLQLKGTPLQSLRAASLVLVPVISGLASALLGGVDIPT